MSVGYEIILDIYKIKNYEILNRVEDIEPLMQEIIDKCRLTVVGKCSKQFEPYGATLLYLLSESHFTIHTFPEKKECYINIFTCNLKNSNINMDDINKIFNKYFHYYGYKIKEFYR